MHVDADVGVGREAHVNAGVDMNISVYVIIDAHVDAGVGAGRGARVIADVHVDVCSDVALEIRVATHTYTRA